jgi:hypothetical protein
MKVTDRTFVICMIAGAMVAFFYWFAWDLPWVGLGIGFVVGLILYEGMTRRAYHKAIVDRRDWADRKPDHVKEDEIIGL